MRQIFRFASVAVVSVCLAHAARAGVAVTWVATGGFIPSASDLTGILNPITNPAGTGLAQLIFSPSGQISPAIASTVDKTSGDNQVWASLVLEVGRPGIVSEYGDFENQNYIDEVPLASDAVFDGSVFVRVFERDLSDIQFGTRYYDSELLGLDFVPVLPPGTQQTLLVNRGTLSVEGVPVDALALSVIPEPSSLGLFAIGAVGAVLRRRRRLA